MIIYDMETFKNKKENPMKIKQTEYLIKITQEFAEKFSAYLEYIEDNNDIQIFVNCIDTLYKQLDNRRNRLGKVVLQNHKTKCYE